MGLTIRDVLKWVAMFDIDIDSQIVLESHDREDLRMVMELSNKSDEKGIVRFQDYKE